MIMPRSRVARLLRARLHVVLCTALCAAGWILLAGHRGALAQSAANPLMQGRGGDLVFPTSCGSAVQPRFDAALAALHSFWYKRAREEFTSITQSDPDCAMAHWGVAMSVWNQLWAPPTAASLKTGQEEIVRARAAVHRSARENDYIEALAVFFTDSDRLDSPLARACLFQENGSARAKSSR
jgi:hypothetical protein